MNNIIKIKKRGDDGYKVISVRIKENILNKIDAIAAESNHSRNKLTNILLENSIENVKIEE